MIWDNFLRTTYRTFGHNGKHGSHDTIEQGLKAANDYGFQPHA
jgi:hypothetical protein